MTTEKYKKWKAYIKELKKWLEWNKPGAVHTEDDGTNPPPPKDPPPPPTDS